MASRPKLCAFLLILLSISSATTSSALKSSHSKAISDLKEAIVKGLGFQTDEFKISGFDIRDALVGQSVAYEFDIEVDNKVRPFRLLEDVNRWEYVDLPIFRRDDSKIENGLVEKEKLGDDRVVEPVLAPFQLAGPMELWLQDAKDMRLNLPLDVDAGVLKKVILAEGAVVTVKGARSVSLRHPLDLPLPLNSSNNGFASGLLALAEHLRLAANSKDGPLVSLRIVGPTSLTSPASSSNRLKLKRLAPGLVELSSPSKVKASEPISAIENEEMALLAPTHFTTMWPLASVNGSNANLRGFEALLHSVLGAKAKTDGSFRLLKADVSAQTFVKMVFGLEKELKEGDGLVDWKGFPEWKTKPESVKMHFEVLAKVDGEKIVPEKISQIEPVPIEDSVAPSVLTGNITMSSIPVVYAPTSPFTL